MKYIVLIFLIMCSCIHDKTNNDGNLEYKYMEDSMNNHNSNMPIYHFIMREQGNDGSFLENRNSNFIHYEFSDHYGRSEYLKTWNFGVSSGKFVAGEFLFCECTGYFREDDSFLITGGKFYFASFTSWDEIEARNSVSKDKM